MNIYNKQRGLTDKETGVLLVLPGIAIFVAVILFPFIDAIRMSFTDRSMLFPSWNYIEFKN